MSTAIATNPPISWSRSARRGAHLGAQGDDSGGGSVNPVDPRMLAREEQLSVPVAPRPGGVTVTARARASHWTIGDTVTLRGHAEPTQLVLPV